MKISDQELAHLIGQRDLQHPAPEQLAALVDQTLTAPQRELLLKHLEGCAQCARAVAITMEPTPQSTTAATPSWLPKALAAAIALVAVAFASVLFLGPDQADDVLRAADSGLSPSPGTELHPSQREFSWPIPDDLSLRRVRLMNESATTLWVSDLSQPPLTMPREHLSGAATFLWQLEDANGNVTAGPHWFRLR